MKSEDSAIRFTVSDAGILKVIDTYVNEYRNLMVLLNDKIYLENFGDCGGQGRCATCIVRVEGGDAELLSYRSRNETTTLTKNTFDNGTMRLSCQILVDTLLNNATIYIEDALS